MSPVEKNEERHEESFRVGALAVGMQGEFKKNCSFLSILFFASTTMITPQKENTWDTKINHSEERGLCQRASVQCMHYLVSGEGWLFTILGILPCKELCITWTSS